jgi:hypothetical protein
MEDVETNNEKDTIKEKRVKIDYKKITVQMDGLSIGMELGKRMTRKDGRINYQPVSSLILNSKDTR